MYEISSALIRNERSYYERDQRDTKRRNGSVRAASARAMKGATGIRSRMLVSIEWLILLSIIGIKITLNNGKSCEKSRRNS